MNDARKQLLLLRITNLKSKLRLQEAQGKEFQAQVSEVGREGMGTLPPAVWEFEHLESECVLGDRTVSVRWILFMGVKSSYQTGVSGAVWGLL